MTEADTTAPTLDARVIYESRPLPLETNFEDAQRRAEVYAQTDRAEVAVIDGYGAQVVVERGHLELRDGVGPDRRVRRYSRIDPPRRVVVGIGTVGVVSLDALRWCSRVGTPLVVLSNEGAILASTPPGRDDSRLLRAQALALYGPAGLAVTQYLIGEKLAGQAQILRLHFEDERAASMIETLAMQIEPADSIDEVRQLEAASANVYFAAFERCVEAVFNRKDVPRVPSHWLRFNGRRSSINPQTPKNATDPTGALLNYGYKLAEVEAGLAARRMGLDPGIGILHADVAGRASFACDLMEAVRPAVDAHVLDLLAGPLRKREFVEDARGVVRCLAPITHRLAEAMPSFGVALGPAVEHVAELLASSSPYDVPVPTVLSGSKHKAAARKRSANGKAELKPAGPNPGGLAPRGKRRAKPPASPLLPLQACRGCGGQLPVDRDRDRPRIAWCADCLPKRRSEIGVTMAVRGRAETKRVAQSTGERPTHSDNARVSRSEANSYQREQERLWSTTKRTTDCMDPAWFEVEVLQRLGTFGLPAIARATGASTTAASHWRSGKRMPHERHWTALARMVGADPALRLNVLPEGEANRLGD